VLAEPVAGLAQPPFDTSLMGVAQGALDHYGIDRRPGETFFVSGHAFVINVHEELCPSGPYCWDYGRCFALLRNLGIRMTPLGTAMPDAAADDRAKLEAALRDALDGGAVCSLLHLDNQLVLGHDGDGFATAQPWGDAIDSTPARLTAGSWREYQAGPPVTFYQITPCEPPAADPIAAALDFAVEVWRESGNFASPPYGAGDAGYANWLVAIDAGHADEHGNWWNAVVWAECRERGGDHFQDLAAAEFPVSGALDQQQARWLAIQYRAIAKLLYRASDKTAPVADKRRYVPEARDLEAACIDRIADLRGA